MNTKEIKETLVGRIRYTITNTPSQETESMANIYYYSACELIHFARDIGFFTSEQEQYFLSKAVTAYGDALTNQYEEKSKIDEISD